MKIDRAARYAAAILTLSSATMAAECIAVGRDGLTARLVNPTGRVSGEVDASGCDIGVYYDRATGTVENAEIHGARAAGILVADGARVGVEAVTIHGLGAQAAGVVFDRASGSVVDSHIVARGNHAVLARGTESRVIALGNQVSRGGIVARDGAALSTRAITIIDTTLTQIGERDEFGVDEPQVAATLEEAATSGVDLVELLGSSKPVLEP